MTTLKPMYVLADEQAVQAFNNSSYCEKYQRECTLAEFLEGKELHAQVKQDFSNIIGQKYSVQLVEQILSKIKTTDAYELLDNTTMAKEIDKDSLSRYVDFYVCGKNNVSILCSLNLNYMEANIVNLSSSYDMDVKGLDYTFGWIDEDTPIRVVLAEEITKGDILSKMYR